MEYTIEKALITDSEEILIIQKSAYKTEAELYNNYDIPPLKETVEELKSQFNDRIILKAISNNQIIGTVRGYEKNNTCYIGRLAVHPDQQNRGIGKALMKAIENHFETPRYELFTGSKSDKDISLYKKLGYEIFKTGKEACGQIELLYMEKRTT